MIRILIICLCFLVIHTELGNGRSRSRRVSGTKQIVKRAESQPNLTARFEDVAEFKIASRKSEFRLGEMITIDVALLNKSSEPLFFRKLSELRISVLNSSGQTLVVQQYGVADSALLSGSFTQLRPREIIVRSFQLLAGCDKRAFAQVASGEDDDLTVFEQELFLNWGDACLPNLQAGSYTLEAQLKNSLVHLPERSRKRRTAVGTIKSNSLEMSISN